jgi:hypothetical protein
MNKELEAQKYSIHQIWRIKQTTDKGKPSANINMVSIFPIEFRTPSKCKQEESSGEECDEEELGEAVAHLTLQSQQAIFDKPSQHWHLKALYMKRFVDGKPMTKMLVNEGVVVNLMPYTMFHEVEKGPGD